MTKEEVIKALIKERKTALHENKQAFDVAIKALEQEPSEDCVSRQTVLAGINDWWGITATSGEPSLCDYIRELPPVTPTQKWIPVSERLPDTDDYVLCWYEYYHWSQEKVLPEYGLGCYLKETSAWFGEVANGKDARVIAWMPLPKPYRAEMEDEE